MMLSKNASSVSDLYKSFLASKEEKLYSESLRELLIALSDGVSTYSQNEASSTALQNILQDLSPKSAGEDCFTECVALYLKFHLSTPNYVRRAANVSMRFNIHQILVLVMQYAQHAQTKYYEIEMNRVLQDCKTPRYAETSLHTVTIVCMILNSESVCMSHLTVKCCCEFLAGVQRLNRKAFAKYFRSYVLWYCDESTSIKCTLRCVPT